MTIGVDWRLTTSRLKAGPVSTGKAAMNLKEGTRRLALLVGVAGVFIGGYGSMLLLLDQYPASAAWRYPFVMLLPILGFFIPWGVVRAIGWVVGGFVANSK